GLLSTSGRGMETITGFSSADLTTSGGLIRGGWTTSLGISGSGLGGGGGGGLGSGLGGGGGRVRAVTCLASAGVFFTNMPKTTTMRASETLMTIEVTVAAVLRLPSSRTPKWLKRTSFGFGSLLR